MSSAKRDFDQLCAKVAKLDPAAAKHLREAKVGTGPGEVIICGRLDVALCWDDTPQGVDYWNRLDHQLRAVEELVKVANNACALRLDALP